MYSTIIIIVVTIIVLSCIWYNTDNKFLFAPSKQVATKQDKQQAPSKSGGRTPSRKVATKQDKQQAPSKSGGRTPSRKVATKQDKQQAPSKSGGRTSRRKVATKQDKQQAPSKQMKLTQQNLKNLNRLYPDGKIPKTSSYQSLLKSIVYDSSLGKWVSKGGGSGGGSKASAATNQDIRNLNRLYPDGKIPTTSSFSALVKGGGAVYDSSLGKWVGKGGYTGVGGGGSKASAATNQDIRNLNRLYPDGKIPTTSSFSALVQGGGAVYDSSLGKWVGKGGYTGVGGGGSKASAATNQDIRNLNRLYPDGKIPTTSKFSALVQGGGAVYDSSLGKWVGKGGYTGVGGSGGGSVGGGGGGSGGGVVSGTNIATNQDIRNLNRMYPSGQVPTTSRFSALVQSGGAVYDSSLGKWVGPTGYTGVGQGLGGKVGQQAPIVGTNIATNQDIRNLNRMYPNGQVPTTSRFSALVQSGGAVYDSSLGKWVGPTGYTGVGQGLGSKAAPVDPYAQQGYVDPYAQQGYVDPYAQQGYVDPYAQQAPVDPYAQQGYVDPYAQQAPVDPYAADPYAQYS